MSGFSVNDNLCTGIGLILFLDFPLQLKDNGASGINDFNAIPLSQLVGLRWLPMGTQQYLDVMQLG